jgi:hypothetical protein
VGGVVIAKGMVARAAILVQQRKRPVLVADQAPFVVSGPNPIEVRVGEAGNFVNVFET